MKEGFEHYYTDQKQPPRTIKTVKFDLKNGHQYIFKSPEGVFAYGKVDRASTILVENCVVSAQDRVLDIGSGFGWSELPLKREYPIYLSERRNTRAVTFSKTNARDKNVQADVRKVIFTNYEIWN